MNADPVIGGLPAISLGGQHVHDELNHLRQRYPGKNTYWNKPKRNLLRDALKLLRQRETQNETPTNTSNGSTPVAC